jgi:signal transduction histidine kinase
VELRVRDNGCGISPRERAKMFEPFFTTKDRGRGMGLGLSICRRILQDHGAMIGVESVPHQFTEFLLRFPAVHDESAEDTSPREIQAPFQPLRPTLDLQA